MTTESVAEELDEYSRYLEADEQDRRALAYEKAADAVRRYGFIPADPAEITGVGPTIRDDIEEFQWTGSIDDLEELRKQYEYLDDLTAIDGVGPKLARRIYSQLGIENASELLQRRDELTEVHGIGEVRAGNIAEAARREKWG